MVTTVAASHRWMSLIVVCLGIVMIILDSTVVNVALPSIRSDLGFSQISLVWVVNAYALTFGGFLLLSGRLGDLFGARRLFLVGIVLFTAASLGCGLATSRAALLWSRSVQGVGGAVVDAVSLSIIVNMFPKVSERAKAMGAYSFVCSTGGGVGVMLGGVLTASLSWHWIFLMNIPIGAIVFILSARLIPDTPDHLASVADSGTGKVDFLGAITVIALFMSAAYAVVSGGEQGWTSMRFIASGSTTLALLAALLVIELHVRHPLLPLGLLRSTAVVGANIAAALWAVAMFSWFFAGALYLQRVLGKDALEVGTAFLPANIVMSVVSLGFSARLVGRYGSKVCFAAGVLLAALGLLLFARMPLRGNLWPDVLPGMVLFGAGAGVAFNPLFLCAMTRVDPKDSGLASGLINTSFMMGGALGVAILAGIAQAWTEKLTLSGKEPLAALASGYHVAFAMGAGFAWAAAVVGILMIPADDDVVQRYSG